MSGCVEIVVLVGADEKSIRRERMAVLIPIWPPGCALSCDYHEVLIFLMLSSNSDDLYSCEYHRLLDSLMFSSNLCRSFLRS